MRTSIAAADDAGSAQVARRSPRPASPNFRGGSKNGNPLRLLGALRGSGTLSWSGGVVSVDYELDLFARGEVRTTSGHLEGMLLAAGIDVPDDQPPEAARLCLSEGSELDIQLVVVSASEAEFEASGAAVSSYVSWGPVAGPSQDGPKPSCINI